MIYLYCAYIWCLVGLSLQKSLSNSFCIQTFNTQLVKINNAVVFNFILTNTIQDHWWHLYYFILVFPSFRPIFTKTNKKKTSFYIQAFFNTQLINVRFVISSRCMYRLSRTSRNVETFLIFALSLKSWSALATVILGNQNCQINIVVFLQIQIKIGDCICIMHIVFPS